MSETRLQSFEGEIKKSPNCGAVLPSMAAKCLECGLELRGAAATNSVTDFQRKYTSSTDYKYLCSLVTSYAIPNTKEDFLEFFAMVNQPIKETKIPLTVMAKLMIVMIGIFLFALIGIFTCGQ